MDTTQVKKDRDAVVSFYRSQPQYFDSTRRSVSISIWLHDMEQIFTMCHIEEHLQVTLASRCLIGDARIWWVTLGEPQLPSRTWAHFRAAVVSRYGPLPARGADEPIRDPAIYKDMRLTRYQMISQDWHAYPGETMVHYCWRFQEAMLPYIPQDIPEPELQALMLLRNGVPTHIRQSVPSPRREMTVGSFTDDILAAEVIAQTVPAADHADEAQDPVADDAGDEDPQYEVGPEDPQYEVGPEEPVPEMPAQGAEDPMDAEDASDDDVIPIDPPEQEDLPVVDISSDDEDDMDDEDDPEEFPLDDPDDLADDDAPAPVVVLSDTDTSASTLDDTS